MKRITTLAIACLLLCLAFAAFAAGDMPYTATVDLTNQITTVYRTEDGSVALQAICSCGGENGHTPEGEFVMPEPRFYDRKTWFLSLTYGDYAKYASRIMGGILFHSVPFFVMNDAAMDTEAFRLLGENVSHGCVRLRVEDSRFISDNCLPGTRVKIFSSNEPDEFLRALLKIESYTGEAEGEFLSYAAYLGQAEGDFLLARGDSGEQVESLQRRLRSLGWLDGMVTGRFDAQTVTALRRFQRAAGLSLTGALSDADQAALEGDSAPLGMCATLIEGDEGPVVSRLQGALRALLLYDGPVDGTLNGDTASALALFARAFGYDGIGVVDGEMQRAVLEAGEAIGRMFTDGGYLLSMREFEMPLATVRVEQSTSLRQGHGDSERVETLYRGQTAAVLARGQGWTRLDTGENTGNARTEELSFFTRNALELTYAPSWGDSAVVVAQTPARYAMGMPVTLSEAAEASGFYDKWTAAVSTGDPDVRLNLRKGPDADSPVLAKLDDGAALRLLELGETWIRAEAGALTGYLLREYVAISAP